MIVITITQLCEYKLSLVGLVCGFIGTFAKRYGNLSGEARLRPCRYMIALHVRSKPKVITYVTAQSD